MEGTPDTVGYMILGYVVVALLMSGLVAYLLLKARNLRAELGTLHELEKEGETEGKP